MGEAFLGMIQYAMLCSQLLHGVWLGLSPQLCLSVPKIMVNNLQL
jgi:hypothetical protein